MVSRLTCPFDIRIENSYNIYIFLNTNVYHLEGGSLNLFFDFDLDVTPNEIIPFLWISVNFQSEYQTDMSNVKPISPR